MSTMDRTRELELLQFACRANRSGAWHWSIAEDRVYWTAVLYELFGLPTDTEIDFEIAMSLFEEESKDRLVSAVEECVNSGEAYDEVLVAKPVSGKTFWARGTGFAEKDATGKVIALHGSFQDISEERKALEAQRLSAIDLELVLQSIPDGFFILDDQWRFTFLNDASEALLRRAPHDLKGKNIWEEFPEARGQKFEQVYRRVMEGGGTETFIEYFEPLETWFQVAAHRAPNWLVVHFRDVTNRIERADELKAEEERFRLIADTVSDVLWDYDVRKNELWITPSWSEKLGLSSDHSEIAPESWLEFVAESDRPRCVASLVKTLRSAATEWREEARVIREDGTTLYVQMNATLLRSDDNTVYRALGNLRNIDTERRLNELEAQNRGLEALRQMTGGIAHDFNNLLAIILGYVEVLEDAGLENDNKEAVDLIGQATDSAAELTRRLLEFSGESNLEVSVIATGEFLERLMPLVKSSLTNSVEIGLEIASDLWPLQIDSSALERAILNLALNARDAMPNGGKLTIECENKLVSEGMVGQPADLAPGRYLCITVSDDGHGMNPDVLARAQEPYFTTKLAGKGTGLGLSSVHGFAKQSGGQLQIQSEVGVGTKVRLYLPSTTDVETPTSVRKNHVLHESGEGHSILIVEDEEAIRSHLERVLSKAGYATVTAGDGPTALELVRRSAPFDLLLTDIVMPGGMNGVELAQEAKELSPDLRVLFTSGFAGGAFEDVDLKAVNQSEILKKPYRAAELFEAIEKTLQGK